MLFYDKKITFEVLNVNATCGMFVIVNARVRVSPFNVRVAYTRAKLTV